MRRKDRGIRLGLEYRVAAGSSCAFLWLLLTVSSAVGGSRIPAAVDPSPRASPGYGKSSPRTRMTLPLPSSATTRAALPSSRASSPRSASDPDILFAVSTGDTVNDGTRRQFEFFFWQVSRYLTKPLILTASNHELSGGAAPLRIGRGPP